MCSSGAGCFFGGELGTLVLLMLLSCRMLLALAGSLGIGYCARLLSCCDAGVLREGLLAYWVLGAAIAAE